MKKLIGAIALLSFSLTPLLTAQATPAEDREALKEYYKKNTPSANFDDYINGIYAYNKGARAQWEEIEEFPPYEIQIDDGKAMWDKKFANGKSYADCFKDGPAVAAQYPHRDKEKSMVITLPLAINNCLKANDEKPLKYKKGKINDILSFMAFESRGQVTDVKVPSDDPKAVEAFNKGKQFWLARRGQLNMSCASCHAQNAGNKIRADILSPALGQTTHFPVYRSKWGTVGTLHRRFSGCNKQVRAKPFKAQGEEYRNLEYFLTAMSNGIKLNGPGARK